jgi:hypothetical protein
MTCAGEEMAVCLFTGGIALQPCRVRGRRGGGAFKCKQTSEAGLVGGLRSARHPAFRLTDARSRATYRKRTSRPHCSLWFLSSNGSRPLQALQASSFRIALAPPHRKKRNGVLKSTYAAHFLQFLLLTASLSHGPSCVLSSTRSRIFRFQELRGVQCVSSF